MFHNLFRDLPLDLKTETMQLKLRRVMCGDEKFALMGRCCHVTCPLLSYWTHKLFPGWIRTRPLLQVHSCWYASQSSTHRFY